MISFAGCRIVLIGGAGFIGHHLALALKERGADVYVIDSLQVNNLLSFAARQEEGIDRALYIKMLHERLNLLHTAQIPLYVKDARDYHSLSLTLGAIQPKVVIHLAAVAHANRSNKDPFSTFDHSLRTLENALDCARSQKIEHFIYFSSSMVYGNFKEDAVTEDTVCEPLGIYGALKFSGEKIVIAYNQVFGLPYTIVRPSALYGPRCVSRRVGQIFIESAMHGQDITVTGDGSDRLDFTYVGDVVQGIIRILESENSRNHVFNLTYGQGRSIAEMAAVVRTQFPHITVRYKPKDSLSPDRGTLSVEKAKRLIGYTPQYPLEQGFVKYVEWYRDFLSI